jgi:hypothetical protein
MANLDDAFVERTAEGFRMRLQAPAQDLSPWYEIVAER